MPVHAASPPVRVSLSAQQLEQSPAGEEKLRSAEAVEPGDTIRYVATYTNEGPAPVSGLAAVLPIPPSTAFVAGSAAPAAPMASRDGVTYGAIPLQRETIDDQGRRVLVEVPVEQYRYLRWPLDALPPGKSTAVSADVRVLAQ